MEIEFVVFLVEGIFGWMLGFVTGISLERWKERCKNGN